MFKKFFPNDYISSVYDVDFSTLYNTGFRLLLFDIDNTLVPHNAPADDKACAFFTHLRQIGYTCIFLSNNGEKRVKEFCETVNGNGYYYKCLKPKAEYYLRAMTDYGFNKNNTLFFGDQIFTDVLGAKNADIKSIMVRPVKKWAEEPQIILKRLLEAIVLAFYIPHRKRNGADYIIPIKNKPRL